MHPLPPSWTLTALVDKNREVLEENGRKLGVKRLFTDIEDALSSDLFDAAVIVTPTFTHRNLAVKCASAGKHIFCEKPISVTVEDAEEMILSAEKKRGKAPDRVYEAFRPTLRGCEKNNR